MHSLFSTPRLAGLALFMALLGGAGSASAACTATTTGSQIVTFTMPRAALRPRDMPIGTVLSTVTGTGVDRPSVTCTAGTYDRVLQVLIPNATAATSNDRTSMASVTELTGTGVGYRIFYTNDNVVVSSTSTKQFRITGTTTYGHTPSGLRLEWVKTAATVTAQTINAQDLATLTLGGAEAFRFRLGNNITFDAGSTCTPAAGNTQTINLGTLGRNHLAGINQPPARPGPVPFQLRIDCMGYTGQVLVTFTDANDAANRSNILSTRPRVTTIPSGSGEPAHVRRVPTGLGIQILRNDAAINFGPDSSAAGTVNQIALFNMDGAVHDRDFHRIINLQARYIQTAADVTDGTIRAAATFTFSYQ